MWQYLLFSHWGGNNSPSFYPFEEILRQPHEIRGAERLPSKEIHLALSHAGGRLELWFDPKVNYLVRKSEMVPVGDPTIQLRHEVLTFSEPSPGVFVPVTVEHRAFKKGPLRATVQTVLSELKVNNPSTKAALRIPGIAGLECIDLTRDIKYKIDADGNRAGPESKVEVLRGAPPVMPAPPVLPANVVQSQPSTSWWVWLLIVSAVIVVAGLALAIVRRRAAAEA